MPPTEPDRDREPEPEPEPTYHSPQGSSTEGLLLEYLKREGITREIPQAETAGEECPVCGDPIPENSSKSLNLGLPDYCTLGCRLEAEDDPGETEAEPEP